jgi:hypothetical protein
VRRRRRGGEYIIYLSHGINFWALHGGRGSISDGTTLLCYSRSLVSVVIAAWIYVRDIGYRNRSSHHFVYLGVFSDFGIRRVTGMPFCCQSEIDGYSIGGDFWGVEMAEVLMWS